MLGTRAIVYARVSTTRQADHDLSIPDQLAHAERYAADKGLEIVGHYIDAGASARDDNRPEFQRMIADIKSGRTGADMLLVHSHSRFFRDAFQFELYRRMLEKHGVSLLSMTQDLGAGSMADMARQFIVMMDEHNSRETSKHVTRSMLENARRGYWNGAAPPYGYRTFVAEQLGKKEKKKLELEPKEAEIVKHVFQLYLYGDGKTGPMGLKSVVNYLNERGHRHRKVLFSSQTVHGLLKRTTYIGVHYFNRTDSRTGKPRPREDWVEVAVPRIIDDHLFHAAQAQLALRNPRKTPARITNSSVLLTGVAKCGECGAPMRLRTGKGGQYRYYTCSAKVDKGTKACVGRTIPMAKLDEIVTDNLCSRILGPERLKELVGSLHARNSGRQAALQSELKSLHGEKRELSKNVQNLLDLMEAGGVDVGAPLKQRFSKRQTELEELNRLIAMKQRELDTPLKALGPDRIAAVGRALRERLRDQNNPKIKRAYLRALLKDVIVTNEEIRITGPKIALAQALSDDQPLAPSMVPTFEQKWCTRSDSNARPPDS